MRNENYTLYSLLQGVFYRCHNNNAPCCGFNYQLVIMLLKNTASNKNENIT